MRDQIDHAAEVFFFPDGQFERNHGSPEGIGQRFQNAFGIGAIAIHAAGHDQSRRLIFLAVVPHPLGDDFHSGDAIDDNDGRIHHRQHQLGFVDEHVEAGRVHDIDFRLAPLHVGEAGGNGHLARDFFFVVIGGGGAVIHAAHALVGARRRTAWRKPARSCLRAHAQSPLRSGYSRLHKPSRVRSLREFNTTTRLQIFAAGHVGTAALGCPAEQRSAPVDGRCVGRVHIGLKRRGQLIDRSQPACQNHRMLPQRNLAAQAVERAAIERAGGE